MEIPELLPPLARYALARDREQWDGVIAALERDVDGNLTLARVPGPADGVAIDLPPPYAIGPSGIAAGPCGIVFVSDTAHHRVVIVDRRCTTRSWMPGCGGAGSGPGQFKTPRGLAVDEDGLAVADSGNARVQRFVFPALDPHGAIHLASAGALKNPTGVAYDSEGREYVLDASLKRVFRFDGSGTPDGTYDTTLQAQGTLADPIFLAVGEGDHLLVSDAVGAAVFVFDANGVLLHQLPNPGGLAWMPGAIAVFGPRIFVHDSASGLIRVFSDEKTYCGDVFGWRGPVTALAVDADGQLLIKPGLDDQFIVFAAAAAYVTSGTLEVGPLDAGKDLEWLRAAAIADRPLRTHAVLEVAQLDPPAPPPAAGDWITAASLDTLLAPLVPAIPPPSRRWLWLRVTLTTNDPQVTPTLRQLRAETPGEDYLDSLPGVYRRTDERHELFRLLALVRGEQAAVDEAIDEMPRIADPDFARISALSWLAEWLAFDLPTAAGAAERRALIADAVRLHERRGTPASIRQLVELHTGIRPAIVEAFEQRALWILGESSRLGFDTALPASDPDGLVVPDPTVVDGDPPACCPPVVGHAVVGESGPLPRDWFGEPLFSDTAHRFDVIVPAHRIHDAPLLDAIRRLIEREKPAHTQYCVCTVASETSVGFQARIGIDTIVGGPLPAFRLDASRLGTAVTGGAGDEASRVGMNTTVGSTQLT